MKLRVKIDDQSFEVEVGDLNARPILATVDGDCFEVWPEENSKALPQVAAANRPVSLTPAAAAELAPADAGVKAKAVMAPIPGVIISVTAKVGDTVSFGQELCVLEAMKMKNQIRANRAGKIAAIHIAIGDQVKHNQMLMEYTD
jgi:glutaconyl-CoA/methylmalonyl-CoA decarboxylase subunit gamma